MVAPAFLVCFEPVETLVDGHVQHVYRHLGLTQRLVYPSGGCQGKPLTYIGNTVMNRTFLPLNAFNL